MAGRSVKLAEFGDGNIVSLAPPGAVAKPQGMTAMPRARWPGGVDDIALEEPDDPVIDR
jgi:hypothetical protein